MINTALEQNIISKRTIIKLCLSTSAKTRAEAAPAMAYPGIHFKHIPAYFSLLSLIQPIKIHSKLFKPIKTYSSLIKPISANLSLFQPI